MVASEKGVLCPGVGGDRKRQKMSLRVFVVSVHRVAGPPGVCMSVFRSPLENEFVSFLRKFSRQERAEKTLKELDTERRALRMEFDAFREELSLLKSDPKATKEDVAAVVSRLAELWSRLDENEAKLIVEYQTNWYRDWETDRKSTRLNSSHSAKSRMPSSA